jgi:putative transcriptional regulator
MLNRPDLSEASPSQKLEKDSNSEPQSSSQKRIASTSFKNLPNGSVCRTICRGDGSPDQTDILVGPQWQLLATREASGMSQGEFARATGISVRTLQEWEQGRKTPSGAAQSLLKLISRYPHLLRELSQQNQ